MALCQIVDHLLTSEGHINIKLPLDEATVKRLVVSCISTINCTETVSEVPYYVHTEVLSQWVHGATLARFISRLVRFPGPDPVSYCKCCVPLLTLHPQNWLFEYYAFLLTVFWLCNSFKPS